MQIAEIPLPAGRSHQAPKRIVVHAMGEFIDTDDVDYHAPDWLRKLGLSAHAFVTPSGVIIRSRPDGKGAYHAKGYNTDSLGVEFLVPGLHTYGTFIEAIKGPYLTNAQYDAGVELVRDWCALWNIENIDRHSDLSPGRKADPGDGFGWDAFLRDVRG
jgi:AmpD protein